MVKIVVFVIGSTICWVLKISFLFSLTFAEDCSTNCGYSKTASIPPSFSVPTFTKVCGDGNFLTFTPGRSGFGYAEKLRFSQALEALACQPLEGSKLLNYDKNCSQPEWFAGVSLSSSEFGFLSSWSFGYNKNEEELSNQIKIKDDSVVACGKRYHVSSIQVESKDSQRNRTSVSIYCQYAGNSIQTIAVINSAGSVKSEGSGTEYKTSIKGTAKRSTKSINNSRKLKSKRVTAIGIWDESLKYNLQTRRQKLLKNKFKLTEVKEIVVWNWKKMKNGRMNKYRTAKEGVSVNPVSSQFRAEFASDETYKAARIRFSSNEVKNTEKRKPRLKEPYPDSEKIPELPTSYPRAHLWADVLGGPMISQNIEYLPRRMNGVMQQLEESISDAFKSNLVTGNVDYTVLYSYSGETVDVDITKTKFDALNGLKNKVSANYPAFEPVDLGNKYIAKIDHVDYVYQEVKININNKQLHFKIVTENPKIETGKYLNRKDYIQKHSQLTLTYGGKKMTSSKDGHNNVLEELSNLTKRKGSKFGESGMGNIKFNAMKIFQQLENLYLYTKIFSY